MKEARRTRSTSKPADVHKLRTHFHALWPDGMPITGIEVQHHVADRYRMRKFDIEPDITNKQIKSRIATGIMQQGQFVRPLPGKDTWVVGFEDEYIAALRETDGKMIVLSYYGPREQMSWYRRQEVLVRQSQKALTAA